MPAETLQYFLQGFLRQVFSGGGILDELKKNSHILTVSLAMLLTFLVLFLFRSLDDNRLTSWEWTLTGNNAPGIFLLLAAVIMLAYVFSRFNPPIPPLVKGGLFLFIFSFLIVMPFWKEPEVIVDASRYFTQAKHLEVYGIGYFISEWGGKIAAWTDMPVVPFLYGIIFKFFGESRIYIQIVTTLLFSMIVALTYFIGKTLWDDRIGFFAGIFLLGMPYIFTQAPLMLVDVPATAFFTLSVFTFIMALERGKLWIVFSPTAIFLTVYSKYSAWLMLSVLVIVFLVYFCKGGATPPLPGTGGLNRRRTVIIHRTALIVSIAVFLIGIVFVYKFDFFVSQIKFLMSYQKPGLKRWGESFISTFFFQIHPFITFAALFSVYAALKKRDFKYLIAGWLVFLILLLQIKRIRYSIMVFPMLSLMASYGICELKDRKLANFIALCVVMYSLVVANFAYLPFMQKMSSVNIKKAGEYLNSIDGDIEVYTIPPEEPVLNPAAYVPILDLFTQKDIYYYYELNSTLPRGEIEKSPLRFTWEYKNPEYYSAHKITSKGKSSAVVIIASADDDALPDYIASKIKDCRTTKIFKTSDGIFKSQSIVTICIPLKFNHSKHKIKP